MSRIDVVIPCYNYGRHLQRCVQSVLDYPGTDLRVLIIDDCSSDDTAAVGRALAASDPRITFRRHERNAGHLATYNEGALGWADGDYVMLLSADDVLTRGALARAVAALDANPDAGLCYGGEQVFCGEVPAEPGVPAGPVWERIDGRTLLAQACAVCDNPVGTPTAVMRTRMQQRLGGYRADMPHTSDMAMWLSCAALGPVVRVRAVQAFKREHPGNMMIQFRHNVLPDLQQRLLAVEHVLREFGGQVEHAGELLAMARRTIAEQALWGAHRLFECGREEPIEALLAFAAGLQPELRDSRPWRTLAIKRRLGRHAWRWCEPWLRRARALLRPGSARAAE